MGVLEDVLRGIQLEGVREGVCDRVCLIVCIKGCVRVREWVIYGMREGGRLYLHCIHSQPHLMGKRVYIRRRVRGEDECS